MVIRLLKSINQFLSYYRNNDTNLFIRILKEDILHLYIMGLDCCVSKYIKRTYVDDEIIELFKNYNHICGYNNTYFSGNSYIVIIETICDESLYGTLCSHTMEKIIIKITDFINKLKIIDIYNTIDVRDYFEDYNDTYEDYQYNITIDELYKLKELFNICCKNNLYLRSSY